MYEDLEKYGLFERESLKYIYGLEKEIRNLDNFKKFCLLNQTMNDKGGYDCARESIMSPIDIFCPSCQYNYLDIR